MNFRLLMSPALSGPFNMAFDQAIMEAVGDSHQLPTLRLYRWSPACLSLGYTQSLRDVDLPRLAARGWDVVRRPTGGRAILHTDELTYSLSIPQDHTLASGDILTSYRRISQALGQALTYLGLDYQSAPYEKRHGSNGPVCFEIPSAYEITVEGKKLIGSAQVRRAKALLQHGTLPLTGDITRICEALMYPDDESRQAAKADVRTRATTLEDALGTSVSWDEVAEAVIKAFSHTFDITFHHEEVSAWESLRIEQLRHEIYTQESWTNKR